MKTEVVIKKEKDVCLNNKLNYTNDLHYLDVEIILDDIEFAWNKSHIKKIINMWRAGRTISYIGKEMNRDYDEVFLLLFHLSRQGLIKKRDNYIWGDGRNTNDE